MRGVCVLDWCEANTKRGKILLAEWDIEKNDLAGYTIYNSYKSSTRKVWWRCSTCSHSWPAAIYNRTMNETGCPECYKLTRPEKVRIGKLTANNLLSVAYPGLVDEWNYTDNEGITPDTVSYSSIIKAN